MKVNVKELVDKYAGIYNNDFAKILAAIGKDLLHTSYSLSLLDNELEIIKAFNTILNIENKNKRSFSLFGTQSSVKSDNFEQRIISHARIQARILNHDHIDEHNVFLAVLKILDEEDILKKYEESLKQMLEKRIHTLENTALHFPLVGREQEIKESIGILSRSQRNNLLIIGEAGVGKTTLSEAVINSLPNMKFIKLSPGSKTIDQVVSIITKVQGQKTIFFLDELFSFSIDTINYIVNTAQIIATSTISSFQKSSGDLSDTISKFAIQEIQEQEESEIKRILDLHLRQVQTNYKLLAEDNLIEETLILAKQYIHDFAFPAKGITLIEELAFFAKAQKESVLSVTLLKALISQKKHIPIGSLNNFDKQKLSSIDEKLKDTVKGQEYAIKKVANVIKRTGLGFKKDNKPIGSFLFVGPSGVGKTELAKTIAKEVFGSEENMIRLDMSEFSEAHMVQRLLGAPAGYVGYEEGGQLTNPVKQKPYSLVLLDEIEKGHPKVFDIFLQVLDDGRLTDGKGQTVDFTNTIIIATSNAGIEDIIDLLSEGKTQDVIETEVKEILEDFFRIEFINRFDDVIIFNALNAEALFGIAKNLIKKLQNQLLTQNITFKVSDAYLMDIAKRAENPKFGARGMQRIIQDEIENELADGLIEGRYKQGDTIEL